MTAIALDALARLVPDGALLALPPDNSLSPVAFARALIRARRPRPAPARRARIRLRHRPADRRRLRRLGADQRRQPRRGRHRPSLRRRRRRRHHRGDRRHLPRHPHHAAGCREGRPLHAAARRARQRRPGPPPGLEGDRQPVRDRAATRSCWSRPCRPTSPPSTPSAPTRRQRLRRPPRRTRDPRPRRPPRLVTVERIVDGNLLDDERLAGGVINGLYVEAIASRRTAPGPSASWTSTARTPPMSPPTPARPAPPRASRTTWPNTSTSPAPRRRLMDPHPPGCTRRSA